MPAPKLHLSPSEAATELGVTPKTLRLYEQHGLLTPKRSEAGWRLYGPADMDRARDIVALRALDLSIADVREVLDAPPDQLRKVLSAHHGALNERVAKLMHAAARVRDLRERLEDGERPLSGGETASLPLPWPWGGEAFTFRTDRPVTFLVGPLGSGKTRLAQAIANTLPNGWFLPLERPAAPCDGAPEAAIGWIVGEGGTRTMALETLVAAISAAGNRTLVIDLIEQGLDAATQTAVMAYIRRMSSGLAPLFIMTRSTAILDLADMAADEAVIYCPANHAPPVEVLSYPGSPGYEGVASCLAAPDVRARTEGVYAAMPRSA